MSSPQMTTMLGLCCCCAPAGAEVIVTAKAEVSKANRSLPRIELLMSLTFLTGNPKARSGMGSAALSALEPDVFPEDGGSAGSRLCSFGRTDEPECQKGNKTGGRPWVTSVALCNRRRPVHFRHRPRATGRRVALQYVAKGQVAVIRPFHGRPASAIIRANPLSADLQSTT
jgi:hypothetical protein